MCVYVTVRGWGGGDTFYELLKDFICIEKMYGDIRYLDDINFKNVIGVIWSNFFNEHFILLLLFSIKNAETARGNTLSPYFL